MSIDFKVGDKVVISCIQDNQCFDNSIGVIREFVKSSIGNYFGVELQECRSVFHDLYTKALPKRCWWFDCSLFNNRNIKLVSK